MLTAVALTACAGPWVDPNTVKDNAKYQSEMEACRSAAMQYFVRVRNYSPQPSGEQAVEMMKDNMRDCLRDHGYTPIR